MKKLFIYSCFSLFFTLVFVPNFFSRSAPLINRIEGVVYDPNNQPINDIRIELQDEVGSIIGSSRTMQGGRFSFIGVSSGRFLVKAVPAGLNYLEEIVEVQVVASRNNSSDTAYVDVYLRYDRRATDSLQNRPAEAVFVQEIPKEAKRLYQTGNDNLKKNPDVGLASLEEAIKIFPNYFDALNTLGREYNSRKDYRKAYPYLLKAIDLNPRSVTAYYSLAYAFFQLNEIPAALQASKAVTVLAPSYPAAHLLYGILLRVNGNYKEAEITLLKAGSLSKPSNPEVYWQLALLYNKLNRNKEAAIQLETYLKVYPGNPDKKKVMDLIAKLKTSK